LDAGFLPTVEMTRVSVTSTAGRGLAQLNKWVLAYLAFQFTMGRSSEYINIKTNSLRIQN